MAANHTMAKKHTVAEEDTVAGAISREGVDTNEVESSCYSYCT